MRKTTLLNDGWRFVREDVGIKNAPQLAVEAVTLPHTWNARDGQDGGNDYHRGRCWYVRALPRTALRTGEEVWLEFRGVAMTAEVYLNGQQLARHAGGYSTFRVNITPALVDENTLVVSADNSPSREVYPQKADFTFYGGIYRDVWMLTVPPAHFQLDYHGGSGLQVTTVMEGADARVKLEAWADNAEGQTVDFEIAGVGTARAEIAKGRASTEIVIPAAHLWDGVNDPYLYTAVARLAGGDEVSARFGCRSFHVDSDKGFFLNGRSYPLCGVSRHQDRQGLGNALSRAEHEEDMALIREVGANTVRLAHYQHDQYFYDLCDEAGMVVWAEIPYITEHMPEARENTLCQMTELVVQNYSHPSIICWGLSNEITAASAVDEDLTENHRLLNDLCHKLDATRPTTMAHMFMLETGSPLVTLPDIRSYNLYYGWYVGECSGNDEWFDDFKAKYPGVAIGLSEYGADANPQYHSGEPEKGDWTESYQAVYHEHMLNMWRQRPYIWAMHVWNMFDFGADGRDEGGKPGQNQKGLVTFDRKLKKDAFYIYKAYLSQSPFVHLCGRRYTDRAEKTTEVKVYSNLASVTLWVDGKEFETQAGEKVFRFRVPISGEHNIEARSGDCSDGMTIRRVDVPNPDYAIPGREVVNWFDRDDMVMVEGHYSIRDNMEALGKCPDAMALFAPIREKAAAAYGDVAKNVKVPESMQKMMNQMSIEASLKQMGRLVTPEQVVELNKALNKIPKPQSD